MPRYPSRVGRSHRDDIDHIPESGDSLGCDPAAEPDNAHAGSVEGCPRAAVWSGCARSTGCHTAPACKIDFWAVTGPSDVEKY